MIYAIQSVLYAHMRSNLLKENVYISTFDISLDMNSAYPIPLR